MVVVEPASFVFLPALMCSDKKVLSPLVCQSFSVVYSTWTTRSLFFNILCMLHMKRQRLVRIPYFFLTMFAWMEVTASKEDIDRDDGCNDASAVDMAPIDHSPLNHLVKYGVINPVGSLSPSLLLPFPSLHSCPCSPKRKTKSERGRNPICPWS